LSSQLARRSPSFSRSACSRLLDFTRGGRGLFGLGAAGDVPEHGAREDCEDNCCRSTDSGDNVQSVGERLAGSLNEVGGKIGGQTLGRGHRAGQAPGKFRRQEGVDLRRRAPQSRRELTG
jgi:hypothetical protein